jgi:hypothetical protein
MLAAAAAAAELGIHGDCRVVGSLNLASYRAPDDRVESHQQGCDLGLTCARY